MIVISIDKAKEITKDRLRAETEQAIQNYIDTTAQSLGYDNIMSIGKYVGYVNPFREECEMLGRFNADCWAKAFAISKEVENGRVIASIDEVIAELPKI